MNESTPLVRGDDVENGHGNNNDNNNNNNNSHNHDEYHSALDDIPEGKQNLQDEQHADSSMLLHDEEAHSPSTHSPRHRHSRTLSFDIVMEDAVEMFHSVTELVTETVEEVREEFVEILEEEVCVPVKPREEGEHNKKLSALALAILVFYKVSGGPFGCEPAVKAAGPMFALLGFACFPLVWCLQEALVTAELGSAYPEPSGAVAWIEEAFGAKAGLVCGYFHWVSGATDNAIYPSLFLQYLAQYIANGSDNGDSILSSEIVRFTFTILISAALAAVNYTGLEIVGNLSILVCIISMSPFVILCILGFPKIDYDRWWVLPDTSVLLHLEDDPDLDIVSPSDTFLPAITYAGVLWRPFVNSLFWNLNSFDVGASFAGEVQDPERVFAKAMFMSVFFVVISYILPLLVAIGASDTHQSEWNAGYFTTVAEDLGGPWLAAWTVFAAAISNVALFEAEMSGDAYQLMGMADRGLIPKVFCKRSRFGTPTNGILVGTFIIFCLGVANFDSLVEMLNFAYAVALLMEFAAFIKLRITDADVNRPFKLPFNTFGCVIFVTPACLICLFVMLSATKMTYVYFAVLTLFGVIFHFIQKAAKHFDWWDYVEAPPKKNARIPMNNTLNPIAEVTGEGLN